MAVHHERLRTVELEARAATVGAYACAFDGITPALLFERDRAPLRAGRERRELFVEAECARGERREDRGGEVRTGERRASHLLLHHDRVDDAEPETALFLGHEQRRPAQVDELPPHRRLDADVVVLGHAAHVFLGRFRPHE